MGNRKVRILNIIGKRPTGGVGVVVYNYQSHFTNKDLYIDYMIFSHGDDEDFDKKVKELGANVYIMPELGYLRVFDLYKKINSFFRENAYKYDAIHLHSTNIGFLCYPIAKRYGIRNLIAHSHATMYSDKKINAIRNLILCLPLKKWANIYFSCSIAAANFLYGEKFVKNGKVKILNNAINCNKFKFNKDIRKKLRLEMNINNKFVIGNIGRFNKQKNHSFIIDIFIKIKEKNDNSLLLLVGDGPLLEEMKLKVKEYNLENDVIFLGRRDDVQNLLQTMDVFLLPSLYEGLPVVGVEAQASGLPCIMSDTISKEVNINNVKYMSLNKSAEIWAEEILEMYHNFKREDTIEKVKLNGFDIEVESKKLEEIYMNLE